MQHAMQPPLQPSLQHPLRKPLESLVIWWGGMGAGRDVGLQARVGTRFMNEISVKLSAQP